MVWASLGSSFWGFFELLDLYVYFLHQVREVFFHYFFKWVTLSLLLLAPPSCKCWNTWSCSRGSFHYPLFWILYSSCCSDWLFFASLYFKSLIWFLVSSTLLLIPYKFFFISISVSFVSDWIIFMVLSRFLEHPYNQCVFFHDLWVTSVYFLK